METAVRCGMGMLLLRLEFLYLLTLQGCHSWWVTALGVELWDSVGFYLSHD